MCNSFISFLPQYLSITRAIFEVSSLCIFMEKIVCKIFYFVEFSYLEQFYSFIRAILLYHFLSKFLSVTWAILLQFRNFMINFIEILLHFGSLRYTFYENKI